jgi:hypothetical protein
MNISAPRLFTNPQADVIVKIFQGSDGLSVTSNFYVTFKPTLVMWMLCCILPFRQITNYAFGLPNRWLTSPLSILQG